MRIRPVLILGCACAVLAACGSQPPRPAVGADERGDYHGGPNAMLLKYNSNHDGTLTREELMAGLHAEFAAAAIHRPGCIDEDEVRAIDQARIEADKSAATPLVDWNHDGCLDFQEFAAAPISLFDQLDLNGDGKITPEEFNPRRGPANAAKPAGRGGRRGGGQGGGQDDVPGGGQPPAP